MNVIIAKLSELGLSDFDTPEGWAEDHESDPEFVRWLQEAKPGNSRRFEVKIAGGGTRPGDLFLAIPMGSIIKLRGELEDLVTKQVWG